MNCPACTQPMTPVEIDGITVDICQRSCGGIWFDAFELSKFDEAHEGSGEKILEQIHRPVLRVSSLEKRPCPKCEGVNLLRHFTSAKKEIEVDECGNCGGIFLDAGELSAIREEFPTQREREAFSEKCFGEVFQDAAKEARKETDEDFAKAQKFANFFRFLCPSYYIPGKQDWGAF